MVLSVALWSCRSALAVTQTAPFLWCEINTSSQLIKACEILQSSLGVSGLSLLTQILSPLPDCHGQSCWATRSMQRKLPRLRWQSRSGSQIRKVGCVSVHMFTRYWHLIMQPTDLFIHKLVLRLSGCPAFHPHVWQTLLSWALSLLLASILVWKQQKAVVPDNFRLLQQTLWRSRKYTWHVRTQEKRKESSLASWARRKPAGFSHRGMCGIQ